MQLRRRQCFQHPIPWLRTVQHRNRFIHGVLRLFQDPSCHGIPKKVDRFSVLFKHGQPQEIYHNQLTTIPSDLIEFSTRPGTPPHLGAEVLQQRIAGRLALLLRLSQLLGRLFDSCSGIQPQAIQAERLPTILQGIHLVAGQDFAC